MTFTDAFSYIETEIPVGVTAASYRRELAVARRRGRPVRWTLAAMRRRLR